MLITFLLDFMFSLNHRMFKIMLFALITVVIRSDHHSDETEKFLARCFKSTKKFAISRICKQLDLSAICLSIETPYVTEVLDYCYKKMNFDPVELKYTLQYICSSEQQTDEAAKCICRAAEEAQDQQDYDISDELNYNFHGVNPAENEDHHRANFNSSMMACFDYMNSIYEKPKSHG